VSGRVNYVRTIAVDPHGLASRDRDTVARSSLDEDTIRAIILYDVGLLDSRYDKVTGRPTGDPGAAQAHVARSLRSVGIRKG
jgi:hypothetical protein